MSKYKNPFNNLIALGNESNKTKKKDGKEEGKKGIGVKSALALMADVIDFRDDIESCMEAQDIVENKKIFADFIEQIGQFYTGLVEIAKIGLPSGQAAVQQEVPVVQTITPETKFNVPAAPNM